MMQYRYGRVRMTAFGTVRCEKPLTHRVIRATSWRQHNSASRNAGGNYETVKVNGV